MKSWPHLAEATVSSCLNGLVFSLDYGHVDHHMFRTTIVTPFKVPRQFLFFYCNVKRNKDTGSGATESKHR